MFLATIISWLFAIFLVFLVLGGIISIYDAIQREKMKTANLYKKGDILKEKDLEPWSERYIRIEEVGNQRYRATPSKDLKKFDTDFTREFTKSEVHRDYDKVK